MAETLKKFNIRIHPELKIIARQPAHSGPQAL